MAHPTVAPPKTPVHRAPRPWAYLATVKLVIPSVAPPNAPPPTALIVSITSLVGLVTAGFIYSHASTGGSSLYVVGFLAISGLAMLGSLLTFVIQLSLARRQARKLRTAFYQRLNATEIVLAKLAAKEIESRLVADPPLHHLLDLKLVKELLWQRQPADPDFLDVRIGIGPVPPHYVIELPEQENTVKLPPGRVGQVDFAHLEQEGKDLAATYDVLKPRLPAPGPSPAPGAIPPPASPERMALMDPKAAAELRKLQTTDLQRDVPLTVSLAQHHAVAIVSQRVEYARDTARALLGHLTVHHSPAEVKLYILAEQGIPWDWANGIPHTTQDYHSLVALVTQAAREGVQRLLLAELIERSNDARGQTGERRPPPPLPHIVIVVDHFVLRDKSPLHSAAVALALKEGQDIGATVISLHTDVLQAPEQATLMIDVQEKDRGTVKVMRPQPPPARQFTTEYACIAAEYHQLRATGQVANAFDERVLFDSLAGILKSHEPELSAGLSLPRQVRLTDIFSPRIKDVATDNYAARWDVVRKRPTDKIVIPIGVRMGNETLSLDFVGDGPHGLLIGATGSGKSELLRSIITALAINYPPEIVNFVLVDYKGGVEMSAYEKLPHTVALLTNMDQAGQTKRFLGMLRAELDRRQESQRRTGHAPLPHLFVIIDEFAEMVARRGDNDATVDATSAELMSIVRLGRSLNIHLLFAAQRPESGLIQKLRGYMQYRLCLRTDTPEDSKEVLGRPDAAEIEFTARGRGYLLRGDSDLQFFQSARVAIPADPNAQTTVVSPQMPAVDEIVAQQMKLLKVPGAGKWPGPLPLPDNENPTPLVQMVIGLVPLRPGTQYFTGPVNADGPDFTGTVNAARPLAIPIGRYDRPLASDPKKRQGWFLADLKGYDGPQLGGPLLILGDLNAGKTTTLQSLLLALIRQTTPDDVRVFALDPTEAFRSFARLPHFADPLEPGVVNISDAPDLDALKAFKERFLRAAAVPVGRRPRLLLVIDDFDDLYRRFPAQMGQPQILIDLANEIVRRARTQEVYLALTMQQPPIMMDHALLANAVATRVVLYVSNRDNLRTALGNRLPFIPDPAPGRGFVWTRRGTLDEIQIAAPVEGSDDDARARNLEALLARATATP